MGQIVYTVASVLILFFILLYIFAILGFYLFEVLESSDMNIWGSLETIFFTLFSLATVLCLGTVESRSSEGTSWVV